MKYEVWVDTRVDFDHFADFDTLDEALQFVGEHIDWPITLYHGDEIIWE